MKNLLIISFLLINLELFSQEYGIDLEKSTIKWTGKESTTSSHYGTLKFIAGTGFKAPTLMERNIYTGAENIGSGLEGSQDLFFDYIYPEDWKADAIALGSSDGFTVTELIDMNDNGTFENSDSLLQRDFF